MKGAAGAAAERVAQAAVLVVVDGARRTSPTSGLARTPQAEAVASEPLPQPATPPEAIARHAPPPAQAVDDFAAMLDRRYAPIPDGRYLVELLAHDIAPFKSEWKSGVNFVVGIVEGEFAGNEIALTLVTEGAGDGAGARRPRHGDALRSGRTASASSAPRTPSSWSGRWARPRATVAGGCG